MPDITNSYYQKGNSNLQILLDWDSRRFITASKPVMNLLNRSGVDNPRGYKAGKIVSHIAKVFFRDDRYAQRDFILQAQKTKKRFEENGGLDEVTTFSAFAQVGVYYRVAMSLFIPSFDSVLRSQCPVPNPVILSIFSEWISLEEYNRLNNKGLTCFELQHVAQKFIAEHPDELKIVFHWEQRRPLLATKRMQKWLEECEMGKPMEICTGQEIASYIAKWLYPKNKETQARFCRQMANAEDRFEKNVTVATYHAYEQIYENERKYVGVTMGFAKVRSDTGSLSNAEFSLVILHIWPEEITAEEYFRRVQENRQFEILF